MYSQASGTFVFLNPSFVPITSHWDMIAGSFSQTTSTIVTFAFILNGVGYSTTYTNYEAAYPSPYFWSIGCSFGVSIKGFIYHLSFIL